MAEVGCLKDGNFQNLQVDGPGAVAGSLYLGDTAQAAGVLTARFFIGKL